MKLENYPDETDTFTFQHNPNTFQNQIDKFTEQKDYAYAFSYFGTTDRLKNRLIINLNGHFDGANWSTPFLYCRSTLFIFILNLEFLAFKFCWCFFLFFAFFEYI